VDDLLPLFPLDLVLFPGTPLPLHIFEPRYKEMIRECLREKKPFGLVRSHAQQIASIGCTAEILELLRTYPDGRMDVLTLGQHRFQLLQVNDERSFFRAQCEFFTDEEPLAEAGAELRASVLEMHGELVKLTSMDGIKFEKTHPLLSFQIAANLPVDLDFKQSLLEIRSERERLALLLEYYAKVIPKLQGMLFGKQNTGGNGWVH
jgi:Lon protease-like protein